MSIPTYSLTLIEISIPKYNYNPYMMIFMTLILKFIKMHGRIVL